jgi:hypothetical protein
MRPDMPKVSEIEKRKKALKACRHAKGMGSNPTIEFSSYSSRASVSILRVHQTIKEARQATNQAMSLLAKIKNLV